MAENEQGAAPAADEALEVQEDEGKRKLPFPPLMILVYVGAVFAASALTELVIVPQVSQSLVSKGMQKEPEKPAVEAPKGQIYVIEDLVVNPAGSGGTRYVAASIGLEASPSMAEEIEHRNPQIKDALIKILSSRTIDELADVYKRESVRDEIKTRVEAIVPKGNIDAVYFVSFVLQ